MSTHAHYAGEFGSQEMTKKLEKDPAYRGARAEHFAREAEKASEAHRTATTHADRAAHALVVAHAMKRSAAHAKAATKMAPGSEHERYAHAAAATAAMHHENVTARGFLHQQDVHHRGPDSPASASASLRHDVEVHHATGSEFKIVHSSNDESAALKRAREYTSDAKAVRVVSRNESGHELKTMTVKKYSGMDELGMSGSAKQPHTDTPKADAALAQLKSRTPITLDRKTSDLISKSTQAAHIAGESSREANRIGDKRGHVAAAEAHRTAEKLFRKFGNTEEADFHAKRAESHDAKAVMSDSSYDHHTEPTESGHELKTADVKKYSGMDELGMQGSPKQPHTDTPKTDAALAQLKTDVATSTPSSKANVAAQAAKTASRTAAEFSSPENHSAAKEAHKTAARVHVATGDLKTAEYHAKKAEEHSSHYANPKKYRAPSGQELLAKFLPKSTTTSDLTKLRGKRVDEHPSHLAEIVHATLPKVPDSGRFSDRKVFTHEVYNAMSPAEQAKFGGTVDKFKDKLVELQKSQHVTLSRADMPQAMDAKQVAASHVSLEGGKHEWGNKLSAHANFVTATGPIPTATVTPKADAALEKLKSHADSHQYSRDALHLSNNAITSDEHHEAARAHEAAASQATTSGDHVAAKLHSSAATAHIDAARVGRRIGNGEGLKNDSLNKKFDEYADQARVFASNAVRGKRS